MSTLQEIVDASQQKIPSNLPLNRHGTREATREIPKYLFVHPGQRAIRGHRIFPRHPAF